MSTAGTMEVAGGAGAKAIKYGVLTFVGIAAALTLGGFGIGWLISAGAVGGANIPLLAWAGGAIGATTAFLSSGLIGGASIISAIFGGAKGASQAGERVREQEMQVQVAQQRLMAAGMEAQERIAIAQATIAAAQRSQPVQHAVPPQFNMAQPTIQASNDNQVMGTVAQAPAQAQSKTV